MQLLIKVSAEDPMFMEVVEVALVMHLTSMRETARLVQVGRRAFE
jgi:hypothetical protein